MDLKQLLSQTNIKDVVKDSVKGELNNSVTGSKTNEKGNLSENQPVEPIEFDSDLEEMEQALEQEEEDKEEEEQEEEKEDDKDEKPDPRFTLPWNKLEKGVKMNRLLIFIQSEKEEHNLTEQHAKELKNLLFKACENGLFNKISDVEYDESKAIIESIKNLEFNESSKKYKIKTGGTKNRSVGKSRSNIDRLTKKK
jgi:hypothetical protein